MPDRLHFTESDEANALIASDPMALLVGFALDQQVTVQKAFSGPLVAARAPRLARRRHAGAGRPRAGLPRAARPSTASRARWPSACTTLAVHVRDTYDGDAARVWTDAADGPALRANLAALPGFGEMKVKALGAVLAKRFGVEAAQDLVPWHPTLGDVDSAAGAGRLPGRQARPQGRVVEGQGRLLGGALAAAERRASGRAAERLQGGGQDRQLRHVRARRQRDGEQARGGDVLGRAASARAARRSGGSGRLSRIAVSTTPGMIDGEAHAVRARRRPRRARRRARAALEAW